MKPSEFLHPAPANFLWPRCPEADRFIEETLEEFRGRHTFARQLAERMHVETSTNFSVWVDHLVLPGKRFKAAHLKTLGFTEDKKTRCPAGAKAYSHPFADLPRLIVSSRARELSCAIAVDALWRFQLAHHLCGAIQGAPYSSYRFISLPEGDSTLYVIERRGSQNFVLDSHARSEAYLQCFEKWAARPRYFDSSVRGMKETLQLARSIARTIGTGPAATLFLEGERVYWQKRNRAAQIQKARQDELGLGWANHDHHTFRSSRSNFPLLIQILLVFGFKKRERYYAGLEAGWGAQVMEQPEAGLIIFADVDLAPEDVAIDFTKVALPDLKKPGTVGLWCALHGESMLEAGMHHLEAKFDFDRLKKDLEERQVNTMPPFSDFPFLRQAFTQAEMWRVPEDRLRGLYAAGQISAAAFEKIRTKGAVGSHMENLQRKDGFKGFNQRGVSAIITAVNPEAQALSRSTGSAGA